MINFDELGLDNDLINAVKDLGFESPMPVQAKVIPVILDEESPDLIALAQTGTGKTAAFGLPLLNLVDPNNKKTQAVILAPTRELCLQIADDVKSFAKYKKKINIAAVFGGASIDNQIRNIKRGAQIISATPGRLVDLIKRKAVNLGTIKFVVLDEADEMLNMGFREELESILANTPEQKKTYLFSATMPNDVRKMANKYMNSPAEIAIGKKNAGAENVEHHSYFVHAKDRYLALKRIVDFYPNIYGIVFCRTRRETQEVADKLISDGYNAEPLHGDLSQQQRNAVMHKFRVKNISLLVATDVAARGLDVDDLSHIINYNLPDENEAYTHRSGRTGRAGKEGISIVIANLKEKSKLRQIEKSLKKNFIPQEVPAGKIICERQLFHLIDRMEKVEVDYSQIDAYLPEIYKKLEWLDREELIKKFVSLEFNRFLEYYKNMSDLKKPGDSKKFESRNSAANLNTTRFFINLGKTDDLKPAVLIGLINDYTKNREIEIGAIDILKNFSFFEIDKNFSELVLKSFDGQVFKGRKVNLEIAANEKKKRSGRSDRSNRFGGRGSRRSDNSRRGDSSGRSRRSDGGSRSDGRGKRRGSNSDDNGSRFSKKRRRN